MTKGQESVSLSEYQRVCEIAVEHGAQQCECGRVESDDDGGADCECGHCGFVCSRCLCRDVEGVPLSPACWKALCEESADD